jgi:hypothetical protein
MGDSERIHVGPSFTRSAKENGWDEATSQDFKVRGADYLKDKIKISSGSPAFHLAGVWRKAPIRTRAHACLAGRGSSESAAHASVDTATLK